MRYTIANIGAIITLTIGLTACSLNGQPTSGTTPTTGSVAQTPIVVTQVVTQVVQPTAAQPQPTVAQPQPTAVRPTVQAQPTAQPQPTTQSQPATPVVVAQPIIGFNPKAGSPGTNVEVFGSGYAPNEIVKIRLGLPTAVGEVLASARADANGRWSTRLVLPDRLPSGDVITGTDLRLVAMNDANVALASGVFAFTPAPSDAPPPAAAATDAVGRFLAAVQSEGGSSNALSYLTTDLRGGVERGEFDIHSLLGEQNPFTGFTIDSFTDGQSQTMPYPVIQVTLMYGAPPQPAAIRHFSMTKEQGQWRIGAVAVPADQGGPPPVTFRDVRDTAATFINVLNTRRYREAAAMFDGDFAQLQQLNPDITGDPAGNLDIQGQLLDRACNVNGFACLQQRRIIDVEQVDRADYLVYMEFNNPDGSLFVLPASGKSTFQFRVQRLGNQLFVMDLPIYVS